VVKQEKLKRIDLILIRYDRRV